MLPLPPPPSRKPEMLPLPPSRKPEIKTPLNKFSILKEPIKQQNFPTQWPYISMRKQEDQPVLRPPRRTNPIVWCCAIFCLVFSLLLILFGIATLIVFISIKPRYPAFDIPAASLKLIYFDSPVYFNGDFTILANFSNPNKKLDVTFEQAYLDLYFSNNLIATQALQTFMQRKGETTLVAVHMISSLVYLPPNHALGLQKQVQSNRVRYHIRGTFRVRARLGMIHYSYWLHGRCELEMSGPPTGVLLAKNCKTKR